MDKPTNSMDEKTLLEQYDSRWGLSRRSFIGSSAAAAMLGLSNSATASSNKDRSDSHHDGDGLSTEDIMQMMLDEVGEDVVPPDSGIYVSGDNIQSALVGIDIEGTGFHIASQRGCDVTISHHPIGGWPFVNFPQIFDWGVDIMTDYGVPEEEAEEAVAEMRESWHYDAVAMVEDHLPSLARLLDQPAMNVHQPVDELSRRRFVEIVEDLSPDTTVGELKEVFNEEIPEVRAQRPAMTTAVGRDDNEIGDVAVYHAAGTNGGASVASALYDNGIDTVMYIHIGYGDAQQLREEYGDEKNLVIIGHQPGDGVGMRRMIELLEAEGVNVTTMSGALVGPDELPPEEWDERQARQTEPVVERRGLRLLGRQVPPRAGESDNDEESEGEEGPENGDEGVDDEDEEGPGDEDEDDDNDDEDGYGED